MRPQRFSYTLYDRSGRNVESGELESDAEPTDAIINSTDVRFPDNWSKKRYQVVRSVYTDPIYGEDEDDKVFLAFGSGQKNLRNRIATTLYQEVYDPSSKKYDHATHYSYDVHGNICQVVVSNVLAGLWAGALLKQDAARSFATGVCFLRAPLF